MGCILHIYTNPLVYIPEAERKYIIFKEFFIHVSLCPCPLGLMSAADRDLFLFFVWEVSSRILALCKQIVNILFVQHCCTTVWPKVKHSSRNQGSANDQYSNLALLFKSPQATSL